MSDPRQKGGHPLPEQLFWGTHDGLPNPVELRSSEGWVIISVWFGPGSWATRRVRWRYTSSDIAFEFEGQPTGADASGNRPVGWLIHSVGLLPGGGGQSRLPRQMREIVEKHLHIIKAAMPYWGSLNPIVPQSVRIEDKVWRVFV